MYLPGIIGSLASFHSQAIKDRKATKPTTSMLITIGESQEKYAPPVRLVSPTHCNQRGEHYRPPVMGMSRRMTPTDDEKEPIQSTRLTLSLKPAVGGLLGR